MEKHTPTPWRVEEGTTLIWGACNPEDQSTYGMGAPIAEARMTYKMGQDTVSNMGEANAAHIVRCVNAMPQMIEAMKNLYANACLFNRDTDAMWRMVDEEVQAALRAAQETGK